MRISRRRITAISGAAVWLTVVAAAFAILSLVMIATPISMGGLVVAGIVAAILVAWAISIIRENLRLPGPIAPRTPEEKAMLRPFLVAVAQIGQAGGRFVLPALGCAPVAFAIAAGNLRESKRAVAQWAGRVD